MDGARQVFESLDEIVVLGAGTRDAEGIGLLKGVAADELSGDLAGEGDDGNGIHHGVDEPGGEVGGAGSGSGAADSGFAGGARVSAGGEGGVLFVAHQDVADVMVVKDVVEGQGDAAGVAEHAIDAFADKAFEQHAGAAHQGGSCLGRGFFHKRFSSSKKQKAIGGFGSPRRWPSGTFGSVQAYAGPGTTTGRIIMPAQIAGSIRLETRFLEELGITIETRIAYKFCKCKMLSV